MITVPYVKIVLNFSLKLEKEKTRGNVTPL